MDEELKAEEHFIKCTYYRGGYAVFWSSDQETGDDGQLKKNTKKQNTNKFLTGRLNKMQQISIEHS